MAELPMENAYQTPLAHQQIDCNSATWAVRERNDQGFVVLRGKNDDPAFSDALANLGLSLPQPVFSTTDDGTERALLWISPDEYLLQLPLAQKDAFIEQATNALDGLHAAVVDNSGAYSCLQVSGTNVLQVLQKLCPYDLGITAFPTGRLLSSHLAKAPVIIRRLDPESLQLLIRFSFADYAWRALSAAAGEYQQDG